MAVLAFLVQIFRTGRNDSVLKTSPFVSETPLSMDKPRPLSIGLPLHK